MNNILGFSRFKGGTQRRLQHLVMWSSDRSYRYGRLWVWQHFWELPKFCDPDK